MNSIIIKSILLTSMAIFPGLSLSQQGNSTMDIFAGHFAREGNNDSPAKTINNNIYIKLYKDQDQSQWIATLFVPYPYAEKVDPGTIDKVFTQIKKQAGKSAYLRGTFGHLEENATVQFERFGYLQDKIIFECNAMSPCSIKFYDGYLEWIKPGIINEHIIKYNHVVAQ